MRPKPRTCRIHASLHSGLRKRQTRLSGDRERKTEGSDLRHKGVQGP